MVAEFERDAAEHKQPEYDHERQIETGESRRVEQWKSEVKRAASSKKPDFVSVPHWTDGVKARAALSFSARQKEMQDADAEIEAIEDNVRDDHYRNQPEPYESHHKKTSVLSS